MDTGFSPALTLLADLNERYGGRDLGDDLDHIIREFQTLREAACAVLTWRQGNLPNLGYIRDNDSSRAAVKQLALAVGWDSE